MAKSYQLYFGRIQIGEINQDNCCFEGEAEATLNMLLDNFSGRVERSFPWKDKDKEMILLIPRYGSKYNQWLQKTQMNPSSHLIILKTG